MIDRLFPDINERYHELFDCRIPERYMAVLVRHIRAKEFQVPCAYRFVPVDLNSDIRKEFRSCYILFVSFHLQTLGG